MQKYGFVLGILLLAAVVAFLFLGHNLFSGHGSAVRKKPEISLVKLLPPPPPPPAVPPPPKPQMPREERMIQQVPVDSNEPKPEPKQEEAPPDLGTGIKGDGPPDGFGLGGSGGNRIGGNRSGGGGGSRWGWYASQVQSALQNELRRDRRTSTASFRIVVRIWPDASGRISRATLADSTGDSSLDAALTRDILPGIQLQEPPPKDMPLPIVLRMTARRPN